MKKVVVSFLLIVTFFFLFNIESLAGSAQIIVQDGGGTPSIDTTGLGDLNNYKGEGGTSVKLKNKANRIIGVIRAVGTVLSVVILIIIGIKYMLGSIEEKAEYKKTLLPYVIGAFMIFTVTLIPELIFQFMNNF